MSTTIPQLDVFSGKWNASEKFFLFNQEGSMLELFEPERRIDSAFPTLQRSLSHRLLNRLTSHSDPTEKPEPSPRSPTRSAQCHKRYFVLATPLGKGGEATVHKAYRMNDDNTLDLTHPFTLKFYQHGDGATEAGINAALGETVERLYLKDQKQHVTVLPFHEGQTLSEYFAQHPTDIATLGQENFLQQLRVNLYAATLLADNLCYLHRTTRDRDVVIAHTDLKHQNVLIHVDPSAFNNNPSPNTRPSKEKIALHIIDFGLATALKGRGDRRISQPKGTLYYMASEAVRGKGIGVKSDVFSSTPLLLNFLGAKKPLADKLKARLTTTALTESPLFCREINRFTQLAILAEPFTQHGALSWDPLSVGLQLSHFVTRMEEEDYQQRASSHEVLIFINTLRLLTDTWCYAIREKQAQPGATALSRLSTSIGDDLEILKARLTLLSLNLYQVRIKVAGFAESPKGLIAAIPASTESLPYLQLNTFNTSPELIRFCHAINQFGARKLSSKQRETLHTLMRALLAEGLSLDQLTRATQLIPMIMVYHDNYTLATDQLINCLRRPAAVEHLLATLPQVSLERGAGELLLNYLCGLTPIEQQVQLQLLSDTDLTNLVASLDHRCRLTEPTKVRMVQQCLEQQTLNRFKRSFIAQYKSEWFCSIFGSDMLRRIQSNKLTTLQQLDDYIRLKPHSRTARVYATLS